MTGNDLLYLVRDTAIEGIEDHISAAYSMDANIWTAVFASVIGSGIGILGAGLIAWAQAGRAGQPSTPLLALTLLLTAFSVLASWSTLVQLYSLGSELTAAQDIAMRLARIYR